MNNFSKKGQFASRDLVIILVLVVLVLLFFWMFFLPKKTQESLRRRKDWVQNRYNRLKKLITQKELLKEKIEKWTERTYRAVIFLGLIILITCYYLFGLLGLVPFTIEGLLAVVGILSFGHSIICLLIVGKNVELNEALSFVRSAVGYWVYKQFRKENLLESIVSDKNELKQLENELKQIDQKLSEEPISTTITNYRQSSDWSGVF